jgi:hypothetical protein
LGTSWADFEFARFLSFCQTDCRAPFFWVTSDNPANNSCKSAQVAGKVLTVKQVRLAAILSVAFALAVLVCIEGFHYYKFRHFVGYGVHMDVVLGNSDVGRRDTFRARVWNLSSRTLDVEGCRLPGGYVGEGILYHWDVQKWNVRTSTWDSLEGADNWLPTPFGKELWEGCNPEVTHIRPFSTRVLGWVYNSWVTSGEPVRVAVHTSLHVPPTQQRILYTETFVVRHF